MDIVLVTLSSTAVETATAQCTSRWAECASDSFGRSGYSLDSFLTQN